MKRYSLLILLFSAIVVLSGCLTTQYKEYKFEFKDKTSGTLTITYVNIFSQIYEDENADSVLNADFAELAADYLEGSKIEEEFPHAKVVSKRLYEKNYQLYGEVVLEFATPADVNLFQFDKKSPYAYSFTSDETFFDGNGTKPETVNAVFFSSKLKTFELTTSISEPEETDQSLLSTWKANK